MMGTMCPVSLPLPALIRLTILLYILLCSTIEIPYSIVLLLMLCEETRDLFWSVDEARRALRKFGGNGETKQVNGRPNPIKCCHLYNRTIP